MQRIPISSSILGWSAMFENWSGQADWAPGKTCRVTIDALLAIFAWASAEKLSSDSGEAVAMSCFLLLLSRPSANRAKGFD